MVAVFHGANEQAHEAFQAWRRTHTGGFHMTEGSNGVFVVHWAQDRRENDAGRGCTHQGSSDNKFHEDKNGCYTTARKVCSESLEELFAWAAERQYKTKSCAHCNTKKFPFPSPSRL
jgi:hypothetical protein